jgi:hypothetical protein
MPRVTFRVLEGVDRGRVFRDLSLEPHIMIGREEGNHLRLNDERVSRFHAKVQMDNGDIILTDLESTNGTRVNGKSIQIRRLRPGDQIWMGRSLLLFGSPEEIAARLAGMTSLAQPNAPGGTGLSGFTQLPGTVQARSVSPLGFEGELNLNPKDVASFTKEGLFLGQLPLPPLPQKMTPSQAARIAEILDLLHRGLSGATENIEANEDGTQVTLAFGDWQRVLAIQALLALYLRAITDPEALSQ